MKNTFALISVFLFSTIFVQAQCSQTVPAGAEVVNGWINKTKSGTDQWMCREVAMSLKGDNNTVYMEMGDTISIDGDNNTIYAKGLGQVTIFVGTGNVVHREASTPIIDHGVGTKGGACPGVMIFTYSDGGAGCDVFSGINQADNDMDVEIFPIPAKNALNIVLPDQFNELVNVSLMDLNGKIIKKQTYDGTNSQLTLDVSEINAGVYLIFVSTSNERYSQRVVIE